MGKKISELSNASNPNLGAEIPLEHADANYRTTATNLFNSASINNLGDVQTSGSGHTPADGDALVWNSGMSHWMPGAVGAGGVTISEGEIDVATASKYGAYFLSPAIYDLTHWNTAETDDTKRKNLEINATGITHDNRSTSSSYWQPGGVFNVRINMTKHLLRAGNFGNASSPPAHFLVSFNNNGGNTHDLTELAGVYQNEVYYGALGHPGTPNHRYTPTGGTGSFIIAAVNHPQPIGTFGNVSGDNFGVFQINGKLHVGLYSYRSPGSTDCTGDIAYSARVTELC